MCIRDRFKRIEDNHDISEAKRLCSELNSLIEFYGLPESMEVHKRLAEMRFNIFNEAENKWIKRINDIQDELDKAEENRNEMCIRDR